jgi:hypothetical protein
MAISGVFISKFYQVKPGNALTGTHANCGDEDFLHESGVEVILSHVGNQT